MLKGTKRQLAKRNQAMMEMLRGRVVRCGAAIDGVGEAARSVGVEIPGGGGVAE
jgi:hypothetical protein